MQILNDAWIILKVAIKFYVNQFLNIYFYRSEGIFHTFSRVGIFISRWMNSKGI